jgi:hypothetical protein
VSAATPNRVDIALGRWRLVLALSLLSTLLCVAIGLFKQDTLITIAELPWWSMIVLIGGGIGLLYLVSPKRFVAGLGLRHPFAYPPHWFGIAFGVAFASLIICLFGSKFSLNGKSKDTIWALMVGSLLPPILVIVYSLCQWCVLRLRQRSFIEKIDSPIKPLSASTPPTLEQLEKWIWDDAEVKVPANDLFDYAEIARRIGRRLLVRQSSAQVLVGKLGAGKSTILALVKAWLAEQQDASSIEIVKVELWPYESPRAAVEGILGTVVEAFSKEVSTSEVGALPAKYGESIARISGVPNFFPGLARRQETPTASLKALDAVATAIGRRYVLWVEDLERFAAGDPDASASDGELERLAPIRALLHGLDQLRSITVVTATTDLVRRFDLEKIARYVERIPDLEIRKTRRLISDVRRGMLAKADVIDPAEPAARVRLGWDSDKELQEAEWLEGAISNFASAVASLVTTPRTLKQGMRRAMDTWKVLCGEIDLDDVIALSVLQEAHPSAFAVVEKHVAMLRFGSARSKETPIETLRKALERLNISPRTLEAIYLIIKELFGREARRRPQGILHDHHANYFQRYLSTPELSAHSLDQPVLRELLRDDDEKIVELLTDDRSAAVEDFVRLVPRQRVDGLLVKWTRRLHKSDVTNWKEEVPPGLLPLWRMLMSKKRKQSSLDSLVAEIECAIEIAAPTNVILMCNIARWLATASKGVEHLLPTPELRERVNEKVRESFAKSYLDRPKELAAQFRHARPSLLLWIIWSIERARANEARGVPFESWPRLVPTLLDALGLEPAVMSTQLAELVVHKARRFNGPDEWVFDEAQCNALFGDVDKFVETMRNVTKGIVVDPRVATVLARKTSISNVRHDDDDNEDDEFVRNSIRNQIDDTKHAEQQMRVASGTTAQPGAIPGQVDGYWYDNIKDIPVRRPDSDPFAVLPEKEDLGDGSFCLFLGKDDDEWVPVSELTVFAKAQALRDGEVRYFVLANDWTSIYHASLHQLIDTDAIAAAYGNIAYARADLHAKTLVILLKREPVRASAAPIMMED